LNFKFVLKLLLTLFVVFFIQQKLPSFDWSDEQCVSDFRIRQSARLSYPGACSLAFQDVMKMVIHAVIGWDKNKGEGREGAFGVPIAYGRADEEQGRNTLHAHIQVWIENFNQLRRLLFSNDDDVKNAAEQEMILYVDKVMSASYGWEALSSHRCCNSSKNTLKSRSAQVVRDCRHHEHCNEMEGKVVECSECLQTFSSEDIARAALERWKHWGSESTKSSFQDQDILMKERLDVLSQRHPYDYACSRIVKRSDDDVLSLGGDSLFSDETVRNLLLHRRYDEHDWNHRPSCFKKGVECRAAIPKLSNEGTYIAFDTDGGVIALLMTTSGGQTNLKICVVTNW
jgi:hypothetical protein